jgi:hypothetical protein
MPRFQGLGAAIELISRLFQEAFIVRCGKSAQAASRQSTARGPEVAKKVRKPETNFKTRRDAATSRPVTIMAF